MSRTIAEVQTSGPSYLGWRGELLAELALARVPGLRVYRTDAEGEYVFLVTTAQDLCFFVQVEAFSSFRTNVTDLHTARELRWTAGADLVRRAQESRFPVVLFLFDADTDHGRYLRLDTLPPPAKETRRLTLRLPIENTITRESIESLAAELHASERVSAGPPRPEG